ncbi:hypothetical protein HY838_01580 [Candidatus Azambacteria bacterium]|nr:hypothetical protein [Candidatus Azambacteria bacterium]
MSKKRRSSTKEKTVYFGEVVSFKKGNKNIFKIVFPEVPPGVMRELRKVKTLGSAKIRNSNGGVSITPLKNYDPRIASEIALSLGEMGLGLSVDATTIPVNLAF